MRPRGRTIRAQQLAQQRRDTPADIAWRVKSREAAEAAVAERQAKYPTLTADNAAEALRYQDERIRFHEARLGLRT